LSPGPLFTPLRILLVLGASGCTVYLDDHHGRSESALCTSLPSAPAVDARCVGKSRRDLAHSVNLGVNYSGADLGCADLHEAVFVGANLSGADLRCASFAGADLTDARTDGADFDGANLEGTELD
jgi:hypothetical protein